MRRGPPSGGIRDQTNLSLGRILEAPGHAQGALRAYRGHYFNWGGDLYYTTFIREEARLADQLGDRNAALAAHRTHLRFRDQADPPLRAHTEQVRARLAAITAER